MGKVGKFEWRKLFIKVSRDKKRDPKGKYLDLWNRERKAIDLNNVVFTDWRGKELLDKMLDKEWGITHKSYGLHKGNWMVWELYAKEEILKRQHMAGVEETDVDRVINRFEYTRSKPLPAKSEINVEFWKMPDEQLKSVVTARYPAGTYKTVNGKRTPVGGRFISYSDYHRLETEGKDGVSDKKDR